MNKLKIYHKTDKGYKILRKNKNFPGENVGKPNILPEPKFNFSS